LKHIADAICIITIDILSSSQQGSMALGAGQRQEGGNFGKRLMLVVGRLPLEVGCSTEP